MQIWQYCFFLEVDPFLFVDIESVSAIFWHQIRELASFLCEFSRNLHSLQQSLSNKFQFVEEL